MGGDDGFTAVSDLKVGDLALCELATLLQGVGEPNGRYLVDIRDDVHRFGVEGLGNDRI